MIYLINFAFICFHMSIIYLVPFKPFEDIYLNTTKYNNNWKKKKRRRCVERIETK